MADNKVNFLRGTSAEYESSIKDNDTFYYTTDDEKLYLGDKEITSDSVTIDNALSDTSENPVQNKVIKAAIDKVASSVGCGELYSGDNTSEIFNNTNNPDESLKNKIIGITSGEHYIHIEGLNNTVDGTGASVSANGVSDIAGIHIEGYHNKAFGQGSHAEGIYSQALNTASHAEGVQGEASGQSSHVGGLGSYAIGNRSFAHGKVVYANNEDEVAFGKYNQSNSDTLFSIGNGTIDKGSNAFEITETSGKLHNKIIATIDDLTAHSGNSEIHVTADEKAAWDAKAELSDIPTTLPANGGNADTLDGLHANEFIGAFSDNKNPTNTGYTTLLDYIINGLTANSAVFHCSGFSDLPQTDWGFLCEACKASGDGWIVKVYKCAVTNVIYSRTITSGGFWISDWVRVNDGGNAASIGAYTEAKLTELEARIAALEGGTT